MVRNRYMVALVFLTFFVIPLLTNILGPIVPAARCLERPATGNK